MSVRKTADRQEALELLAKHTLTHHPGGHFTYTMSNVVYLVPKAVALAMGQLCGYHYAARPNGEYTLLDGGRETIVITDEGLEELARWMKGASA